MVRNPAKQKPARRKPGRPHAATATVRDALLDNALRLFATEGIAHSNLRKIAQAANTTPAMIHYHFGGKEQLIKAVVAERVRAVTSVMHEAMSQQHLTARHMLSELMQNFMRVTASNPWVPKLVLREVYNEHGALRDTFVDSFGKEMSRLLLGLIERAQKEGTLKKSLDSRAMAYAFLSLAIYPVLSSPVIPNVLGLPHDTESMLRQAAHNFDVFMTGVSVK